jgi:hypothetical protein
MSVVRMYESLPSELRDDIHVRERMGWEPGGDAVTVTHTCGCQVDHRNLVVLCKHHEGFRVGYDAGYASGYEEAISKIDRMDTAKIRSSSGTLFDGLAAPVKVPLWSVVYAVRYGAARLTYACADAGGLARTFWDTFPEHVKRQIEVDVEQIDPVYERFWEWLRR